MAASRKKPARTNPAIPLERVLKSLADPVRMSIVRQLLESVDEKACGCFEVDVCKATMSHHLSILEEAGVVHPRCVGTRKYIGLNVEELDRNYPGLLDLVRAAQ